jgi:hypothetical protein
MNEPTQAKRRGLFPATFLIFLGLVFLLRTLHLLHWNDAWPLILVGIGTMLFISGLGRTDKGAVFPGTVLILVGVFFFLWSRLEFLDYLDMDELWPVFPLIVGVAFFVLFLVNPKDWGTVIPGAILIFISLLFFFTNFGLLSASQWVRIGRLWPLILIIIGIGLLLGRKKPS